MLKEKPIEVFYPFPENPAVHQARTTQALNTAASLAESGVGVTLFLDGKREEFEGLLHSFYGIQRHNNFRVEFASCKKKILGTFPVHSNRFFYSQFLRLADKIPRSPDIIFCRHLKIAERLLRERPFGNVPVVFESHEIFHLSFYEENKMHGLKNKMKYRNIKKRETRVYKNIDTAIAINSLLLKKINGEFSREFHENIVPDGTAFAGRFSNKKFDAHDNRIFYSGSFHPWKGVNVLVEALQFLKMTELVLMGPMNGRQREELTALSKKVGVSKRVCIRKPVSPAKMGSVLEEINFAAIPNGKDTRSRLFTSPLKLFDYMAAGAALIASDHPSLQEVVGEEKIGWAEPENPRSFANAYNKLRENPVETQKTVLSLMEKANGYSWKRRGERIHEILAKFQYV